MVDRIKCDWKVAVDEGFAICGRKVVFVFVEATDQRVPVLKALIALERIGKQLRLCVDGGSFPEVAQLVEALGRLSKFALKHENFRAALRVSSAE